MAYLVADRATSCSSVAAPRSIFLWSPASSSALCSARCSGYSTGDAGGWPPPWARFTPHIANRAPVACQRRMPIFGACADGSSRAGRPSYTSQATKPTSAEPTRVTDHSNASRPKNRPSAGESANRDIGIAPCSEPSSFRRGSWGVGSTPGYTIISARLVAARRQPPGGDRLARWRASTKRSLCRK
jgi:hypothetical protein